ncbi:MAG TPA: hypothetical protein VEX13_15170, partial [Chloroflexia bacterium]|nr:hypothetical protein [Chloroflexia bacterium]
HVIARTHYGFHDGVPHYNVEIINAPYGLMFGKRGNYLEIPAIEPAMRFDRVEFYPVPAEPISVPDQAVARWQGFKDFATYCREKPDSELKSTCPPKK